MQILRHSILRLLRRRNIATSGGPMHRLVSTSRPLSFMASAPPRWWGVQFMAASDPPVRRVTRFPRGSRNLARGSGIGGEEELGKPDSIQLIPSTKDTMISLGEHSESMKNVENSDKTKEFITRCICGPAGGENGKRTSMYVIYGDEESHRSTVGVIGGKQERWGDFLVDTDRMVTEGHRGEIMVSGDEENVNCAAEVPFYPIDGVDPLYILPDSSHRDGALYRDTYSEWKKDFFTVDRRETRVEAMIFSNPLDCYMAMDEDTGTCMRHSTHRMLQIFSLKVAKIPIDAGKVELYGYIAARDVLEPLLNYVVNVSRDDPIIVEQGSLINMAPKRGIRFGDETALEYDMRIKTGEHEEDDLQLIDGVSVISLMEVRNSRVFTSRIIGDCGAIDISAARMDSAVEATVQVLVSEVQGSFGMRLGCVTSGRPKEIQLFNGTISEPRTGLKRYVVAVEHREKMYLKFKVGTGSSSSSEHCCSFTAQKHGHVDRLVETDFASISVKVTWSVLPDSWECKELQALLKSRA